MSQLQQFALVKSAASCYTVCMDDAAWMRLALAEAERAMLHADVPVGAVAVYEGRAIGLGRNRREVDRDPTAHAELIALREASRALRHWRLDGVTLYCTLEPCVMCAGAMVLARLPRLVYAASDPKAGAAGSVLDTLQHPRLNHRVQVESGLLAEEAAALLVSFFGRLRAEGQRG
jgi:tRNA(adenine34) deaminase